MAALVAIAGSQSDNRFAVIDFTNSGNPSSVQIKPPFSGGCAVDCSGTFACVGNTEGGQIAVYDISNPATPVLKGSVTSTLSGITAISVDGSYLVAADPQSVVFIDITIPAIVSTFITSIVSIDSVSLKGTLAVVSANNSNYFITLNYSNPTSPIQTRSIPGQAGVFLNGAVNCDLDGTTAVVADAVSSNIYYYNIAGGSISLTASFSSAQTSGIDSLSISGTTVAASSNNDLTVSLVSFQNPSSPSQTVLSPGLGGPLLVKLSNGYLFVASLIGVNASETTLFSVSGTTATKISTVGTGLVSVPFSIGLTTFSTGTVPPPTGLNISPLSLDFGTVRVGSTSTPLEFLISNPASAGTPNIDVSVLKPVESQFDVTPLGALQPIGAGITRSVQVKFTPTAAQTYSTDLSLTTSLSSTNILLPLNGIGGYPEIVIPGPLDFGSVSVCVSHILQAYIQNKGAVNMTLSNLAVTGNGFSLNFPVVGFTFPVAAGGSNHIPVTFQPTTTGPVTGTLTFSTDDPAVPEATVPLSGTGTP
jgi:hypothetical protein